MQERLRLFSLSMAVKYPMPPHVSFLPYNSRTTATLNTLYAYQDNSFNK